jgi:hypothetical protein
MDKSHQYWQDKSFEALNSINNTIMSISAASIAFIVTTMDKQNVHSFVATGTARLAMLLFIISIWCAIFSRVSRLGYFQFNMNANRPNLSPSVSQAEIERLITEAEKLDKRSSRVFNAQIIFCVLGLVALTVNIYHLYPGVMFKW